MSPDDSAFGDRVKEGGEADPPRGIPSLHPFGLVLHHDGRWSHEGQPILNRKLREKFDRSVVYLPEESEYVVQVGRFRGQIEIEEAGFFVREIDLDENRLRLSDGTREPLVVDSLGLSTRDGALLCRIKWSLAPGGLPARFSHSSQSDLWAGVGEVGGQPALRLAGADILLPAPLMEHGD